MLKVILWYVFGVRATLEGVQIQKPKYIPFEKMSIELPIRGKWTKIVHQK